VVTAVEGPAFLHRDDLDRLIGLLRDDGRTVIGPTVADGVIVYDEIRAATDLPIGWRDAQAPGNYRLASSGDQRAFGYSVGPTSWKRYTFPPRTPIGEARRGQDGLTFEPVTADPPELAFLGVRGCELAALRIQDRVLMDGPVADPDYVARRRAALVIAVECSVAGATCFCTSMGTGPEVAGDAADLILTELEDGFVVRGGSDAGRALAERLPLEPARTERTERARASVARVRAAIGDPVAIDGLHDRLLARLESPRWAEVAERCLACANCTLVCPTCFCTSVSQRSQLDASASVSVRSWDSCFSGDFAKVAGGNFRSRRQDRYRQWLTHKFATWVDQFGTFGCVGCGRCITWCPVGIDVREELSAIASPPPARPLPPAAASTPGAFVTGRIEHAQTETADTTTLVVGVDPVIAAGQPGQFLMVTRPGLPALPISVSRFEPGDGHIELSIRSAGPATATLGRLTVGDELGLRGPLGRGWPIDAAEGRDVIVVAGGIGLSPLRPLIDQLIATRDRFGTIRIFHGARTPADRPHLRDLEAWAARADIELGVTVDRAGEGWRGPVGVVTHLFDDARWDGREAIAFVCGPERMMQATAATLLDRGLRPERIHVSLERHMECGIGLCGHCQMGRAFVCRDGPVFSLAELGPAFSLEGI
jgi:NAD(P)H-flavin reductase/formate hydrogenlyase subunit 6/NADH:ubiquinone oxidoreductase subunit I